MMCNTREHTSVCQTNFDNHRTGRDADTRFPIRDKLLLTYRNHTPEWPLLPQSGDEPPETVVFISQRGVTQSFHRASNFAYINIYTYLMHTGVLYLYTISVSINIKCMYRLYTHTQSDQMPHRISDFRSRRDSVTTGGFDDIIFWRILYLLGCPLCFRGYQKTTHVYIYIWYVALYGKSISLLASFT